MAELETDGRGAFPFGITQPWICEAGRRRTPRAKSLRSQGVEEAEGDSSSFCSEKLGRGKDLTWGGLRGVTGMGAAS